MTVENWWVFLCVVASLNILAWVGSALYLNHHYEHFFSSSYHQQRRWMLWLSGVYTAGCAFRSFLPRVDLERICLVPTELSNMMVGRSVATVAELCLMAQCALLIYQAGSSKQNKFVVVVSLLLFPMIVVAEFSSWYAILSTNYFGHVLENSIWTLSGLFLLVSLISLWPKSDRRHRHFLVAMIVFAIGYILFMVTVDVPMYWSRWKADLIAGTQYLSLSEGFLDASKPCVVDFSWNSWYQEIPWLTLYFTLAVWMSLSLAHAPGWYQGSHKKKDVTNAAPG